jgi:DNA topoisomerase-1
MRGLSAGRVQSVATRLVVERERERMAFHPAEWWDLLASFDPESFEARLVSVDGQRVAQGRDFGPDGKLRGDARPLDEEEARGLASRLEGPPSASRGSSGSPRPSPEPAFHDLDPAAGREPQAPLHRTDDDGSPQRLYENGYITCMRRPTRRRCRSRRSRRRASRRRPCSAPTTSRRSRAATSGR